MTSLELTEENLIRLHSKGGITWHAIEIKKIVTSQLGERDPKYSTNVDNLVNVVKVHNMLVGPFFDNEGNFKGVVQLINKKMQGEIDQSDIS